MKYRVLLLGINKVIIDEFFDHLQEFFDAQTTSIRRQDMICHIKYFKPDAVIFCMHNEAPETVEAMKDFKPVLEQYHVPLVIVGSQKECDDFEKTTHHMSRLVLTKPISGRGIKEKFYELMESMHVQPHADITEEMDSASQENIVGTFVDQVMEEAVEVPKEYSVPMEDMPEVAQVSYADEMQRKIAEMVQKELAATGQGAKEEVTPVVEEEMPAVAQVSYADEMQRKIAEMVQKELAAGEQKAMANQAVQQSVSQMAQPSITQPMQQTTQQQEMPQAPTKKHVLVVDDDPMMLKLIKEQLKDEYAVGTAVSGNLAMKFLENKSTDLILLDYEMPLENGAMVLKRLRRNPTLAKLPVIFLTGVSDRQKIKEVIDLKPRGYLLKPIEKDKLIGIIKKTIG